MIAPKTNPNQDLIKGFFGEFFDKLFIFEFFLNIMNTDYDCNINEK